MLIPGMIVKRGLAASAFPAAADRLGNENSPLKQAAHLVLSTASRTFGSALGEQQEVLMFTADILIDAFAADTVALRAGASGDTLHRAAAAIYTNDAIGRAEIAARNALAAMGDAGAAHLPALRRLMDVPPVDTIPLRHQVADALLARRKYPFA
jgi:hypothetical protein